MSTFSPAGQDAGETGQGSPEKIQGALPLVSVCILSHITESGGSGWSKGSLSWVNG